MPFICWHKLLIHVLTVTSKAFQCIQILLVVFCLNPTFIFRYLQINHYTYRIFVADSALLQTVQVMMRKWKICSYFSSLWSGVVDTLQRLCTQRHTHSWTVYIAMYSETHVFVNRLHRYVLWDTHIREQVTSLCTQRHTFVHRLHRYVLRDTHIREQVTSLCTQRHTFVHRLHRYVLRDTFVHRLHRYVLGDAHSWTGYIAMYSETHIRAQVTSLCTQRHTFVHRLHRYLLRHTHTFAHRLPRLYRQLQQNCTTCVVIVTTSTGEKQNTFSRNSSPIPISGSYSTLTTDTCHESQEFQTSRISHLHSIFSSAAFGNYLSAVHSL
jgi:hypothetical protein